MNSSELLRKLADIIDQKERPNRAVLSPAEVDHTDCTEPESMVPPLQQKLELLKKAVGVDNIYGDDTECCDVCGYEECQCCDPSDEIAVMKRNAGLPGFIQIATCDNNME